jgi:DNA-binding MarR family transcriptional regulator
MAPPSDKRLAWLRVLEAHTRLVELMEDDLRRDCGVPLAWYDVLIKIWLAPGHRIRMAELAEQVLLSRSWLTRRVVQLEDAGLVTRTGADGDGRGVLAEMTPAGLEAFAHMERSHARSIATHFSAHLSQDEARVVATVFSRISSALAPAPRRPPPDPAAKVKVDDGAQEPTISP